MTSTTSLLADAQAAIKGVLSLPADPDPRYRP